MCTELQRVTPAVSRVVTRISFEAAASILPELLGLNLPFGRQVAGPNCKEGAKRQPGEVEALVSKLLFRQKKKKNSGGESGSSASSEKRGRSKEETDTSVCDSAVKK